MKKNKFKIILFLLVVLLISNSVLGATSLDDLKNEKKEVDNKIEEKSNEITNIKSEINQVNSEIKKLDKQINQSQNELNVIQSDIDFLETEIDKNIKNLEKAKISLDETEKDLNSRLRTQYISGDMLYLEIIFGSGSISDLITKFDILKTLNEQDQEMMSFTDKQITFIEETEEKLKAQQEELKVKLENEKNKKAELERANREKLNFMQVLETNKNLAEAEYDDFINLTESLDSKITNLERELEAKRKAEEARRKAEAERIARENQARENQASQVKVSSGNGKLSWPLNGYSRISSYYGYRVHPIFNTKKFHSGLDIPAPQGTPISAADSGIVIYAGWQGGYGNAVMISHGDGIVTLYGHNSSINVKVGDYVDRGDTVAFCGNTGYSTGPHLHFEVRINGATTDPLSWL